MAFITYPLNNIDYTAEDAELFHCTRTSGIWAEDSFPISVTGADNNITIGKGIAWINNEEFSGKVTALKSAEVLDLGIADSTYPRIDVIAIQFNANNNATDVIVKKGTPASNPVRPAIVRNGAVYELYIASVYRPAGATAVTASNITDLRMDATVCGLMADSVTKIDMDAIRAQLIGLVEELEEAIQNIEVGEIVPIEKGGTNAQTAAEARQNINFIGINPIASIEEDTVSKWASFGTGVAFINKTGLITNQPSQYAFIETFTSGSNVFQIWHRQGTSGMMYVRAGDLKDGWYSSSWVKQLDETNGIQMKKLWQNASPTSDFAAQTVSLDLSGYDHILLQYYVLKQGADGMDSVIVPVGDYGSMNIAASLNRLRTFRVLSTGVVFQGALKWTIYSSSSLTDNAWLTPYRIYGIKGVQ